MKFTVEELIAFLKESADPHDLVAVQIWTYNDVLDSMPAGMADPDLADDIWRTNVADAVVMQLEKSEVAILDFLGKSLRSQNG